MLLILEEGRAISNINKEFNPGEGTVRSWIRQFDEECEINPDTQNRKDVYEENRKLQKELEEVKKEILFLKKAAAFFAKQIE